MKIMEKPIIIFASSRSNGNTFAAVKQVMDRMDALPLFLDLANYAINDFDYDNKYKNDDFTRLIEQVLNYKTIILATPVYWYTMSAPMKRFVDRLTDLLSTEKDSATLLCNKNLAVITSYANHPEGKDGFEPIFVNTANFLGMNYLGCYFHYAGEDENIRQENSVGCDEFVGCLI